MTLAVEEVQNSQGQAINFLTVLRGPRAATLGFFASYAPTSRFQQLSINSPIARSRMLSLPSRLSDSTEPLVCYPIRHIFGQCKASTSITHLEYRHFNRSARQRLPESIRTGKP